MAKSLIKQTKGDEQRYRTTKDKRKCISIYRKLNATISNQSEGISDISTD